MRIQGDAELSRDPELLGSYKEAELVIKVTVDKIFQNCPRYIHRYQRMSQSPYVPREEQNTPMAGWKRVDIIQDVLKEEEREKVKAAGGTMSIKDWMEKVETGAEDA